MIRICIEIIYFIRFGHSMVPGKFSSKSRGRSETPLQLSQTFFKPADMKKTGFMDGLVRGMAEQGSKLWDNSFVEDIRYHELYIA